MSGLAIASILIGLAALAGGGLAFIDPARVRQGMEAFPRSVWPGRILVAIDLVWAAYEVADMHLGTFDAWKVHLYWITPLAVFLSIRYLDELLSPRALGGLLLLLAGPVLDVARWHLSAWRLILTTLAYLWILVGLLFLLAPWWFRRITLVVAKNDAVLRVGGIIKAVFGLVLVVMGLWVY